MERLEERVVLSTFTWSGIDASAATPNNNWSDPNNWQGNVAPTGQGSDTLLFPTGLSGAALTSNDNISGGSFAGLTIADTGYTITGGTGITATLTGPIDASLTTGLSTLNLPIDFGSNPASVTVDNAAATLVMGGAITGSQGLTSQGLGTLTLTGTNTYTGGSTVAGGTLLVDGSGVGTVSVNAGNMLGGTGTVGAITTAGGYVSPGDPSSSPGILTDAGNLTLDSSGTYSVTINGTTAGTGYDQLSVGGTINLAGATLNLSLGALGSFTPTVGQTFTILKNTGGSAITGQFHNLPQDGIISASGYAFQISYTGGAGNDVVLTSIAAPVDTWTGGDVSTSHNWSDANNWSNGAPVAGDALVFPTGPTGAALTSNNDLTSTTFYSLTVQAGGYTITGNGIGLASTLEASQGGTGSPTSSAINLPITFNQGAGTVKVDNAGASLSLGGVITAPSGLTKQGDGDAVIAANDGTLSSTVTAGALLVDNTTGAVAVGPPATGSTATLGGTGTVASIATTGGAISPGDPIGGTGILTDSGNLTLDAGASLNINISGTTAGSGYDQLVAGGTINLANAALNVSLGSFTPTVGQSFTILHNTGGSGITGTFASLPDGSVLHVASTDFVITYQGGSSGQDVVLTVTQPPTLTWTGADTTATTPNDNWSDPNNWLGGAAPTGQAGETLVFPAGLSGTALTSNDNIANGAFAAILIQGSGYTIASSQGDGVKLTGGTPIDATYSSGSSTFNLPVDLNGGSATLLVDNQNAGLKMGGAITNSSTGVTKAGAGVLDLLGINTYTGATTIAAGNLLVDGSVASTGGVAVQAGATLGGVGTVPSISSTSGIVSPGDSPTLTGVLTAGSMTLDSGSTFAVNINGVTAGTNYSQLASGGAINLASATLSINTGSFNPTQGQTFTIIRDTGATAVTGTFAGLAEGSTIVASGHTFSISYAGGTSQHDVVLTAVSPTTFTWKGTDAAGSTPNTNWSDPNNWQQQTGQHLVPGAGDTLIFPSGLTGGALNSNNDLGNITFNSITVQGGGYVISGNAIGLAGTIDAAQSGSGSSTNVTLSLPITFNPGAGSITVDNAGASLLMSSVVSASSGVTKAGQGALSLTANDGALPAIVNAGTLLADGTIGNVSANTGSTLGGGGSVSGITTVSATLGAGDTTTGTGVLTDSGNLVLDSKSTFKATLNGATPGTGYDQIIVAGGGHTINLNGATLNVSLGSSIPTGAGQKYTIISNTTGSPITGTFAGLAEGATLTVSNSQFTISYQGGTSGHDVVLTSLLATTTTVSPVTGSLVSGQGVTLTATVQASSGSSIPTGTVSFSASINGATVSLGSAVVDSTGKATVTTTNLTAGSPQITATYSGSTTYGTSTSAAVTATVAKATTSETLTGSPSTALSGQLVALTATVSAVSPGSGTPTGSVTFYAGSTSLGAANLAAGVAVLNTSALPVGSDSITAVYAGDTNFLTITSQPFVVTVSPGTTTVSISASNDNPFALSPITLTAIVSLSSGTGTPTGTVTFQTSAGTTLGTATLTNGQATLTTANLPIGQQSITAVYTGSTTLQNATSAPLSVVIGHPNDLYVNQIYLDILGIGAGYNATYWIALLNSGYSRKGVVREILKSRSAKASAIEHVYESLLHRPATSAEVARGLRSGKTTTTPLYAHVFGSREFFQSQGHGTNDGWLAALAQDWFGAAFPASVQARLAGKLAHGTPRATVANQVITSPSGVSAEVNTIIENVLGRPATAADQKTFGKLVRQGNMIGVYETLFTSNEFITKYTRLV